MTNIINNRKKIIVVGSGWGASSFLKNLNIKYLPYEIIIISPTSNFLYTPLLINSIFNPININFPILNLCTTQNKNIIYIQNKISSIDFEKSEVYLDSDNKSNLSIIKYDYLILSHGSEVNTFNISGVNEYCYSIKTQEDVISIQKNIEKLLSKESSINNLPKNIAIIGTNLSGVELSGYLIDYLKSKKIYEKYKINAIDGLKAPIIQSNKNIQKYILNYWKKNNINIYMNEFVKHVDNKKIYTTNETIPYDIAFWCGGIKSSELSKKINKSLGVNCSHGIPVNKYLQVFNVKQKNVYAIGDCSYNKLPPCAQVASQEGKYVASLFNNNFNFDKVDSFKYYHKGQISYIGDNKSVYFNGKNYFHGNLTKYLNNFIHIYNAIHYNQSFIFAKFFVFNDQKKYNIKK